MTLPELDQLIERLTSAVIRAEHRAAEAAEELEPCEWCGGKGDCKEGCRVGLEGNLTFSEFFNETRGCK